MVTRRKHSGMSDRNLQARSLLSYRSPDGVHHARQAEDPRRSVPPYAQRYLLRRAQDPEDLAPHGEGGRVEGVEAGFRNPSRGDPGAGRALGAGVRDARKTSL